MEQPGHDRTEESAEKRRFIIAAAAVFVLAFAVRLTYLAYMQDSPYYDVNLWKGTDCKAFLEKADDIASGDVIGEGVYYQAPFYPYLMALLVKLFSGSIMVGQRLFQFLLGSITAVMALYMGYRLRGPGAGIIAGAMTALYGPLIFYEGAFLRAGTITFLNTLLVLLMFTGRSRSGVAKGAAVGAVFGMSVLTKPNIAIMLPALAYWLWDVGRTKECASVVVPNQRFLVLLQLAGGFLAGFLLVMSPLWVRNYKANAEIFSISRRGPLEFVEGNYPGSPAAGWRLPEPVHEITTEESGSKLLPAIKNTLLLYKDRPLGFVERQVDKTLAFLSGYEPPNNLNYYVEKEYVPLLRFFPAWPHLLAAAVLGIGFVWRKRTEAFALYSYVILYSLVTIAFYVLGRFRVPLVPVLCVFAGAGIWGLVTLIREKKWTRVGLAAAVMTGVFLLSFPFNRTLLGLADHYNLVRFHAIQKDPYQAHEWIDNGLGDLESRSSEMSGGAYHYHRAFYMYMGGKPLKTVLAELDQALSMTRDPQLRRDIERLVRICKRRQEGKDPQYMGIRGLW